MSELEPNVFITPTNPEQQRQDLFEVLVKHYGHEPEEAVKLVDEFIGESQEQTPDAA